MNTTPQVLLVDDNAADTDLATDALARCQWPSQVCSVGDGEQAMAFLHREGKYAREMCPDLVILDLNMPRKDGRAVLAEVKADPVLHSTPIVVFSSSQAGAMSVAATTWAPTATWPSPETCTILFRRFSRSVNSGWAARACRARRSHEQSTAACAAD